MFTVVFHTHTLITIYSLFWNWNLPGGRFQLSLSLYLFLSLPLIDSFVLKLELARKLPVCRCLCLCLCLCFCLCLWLIPLFWNWNLLERYQCADGTRGDWSSCIWVLILEIACFPQHNQLWLVIIQLGAVLIFFVKEKKIKAKLKIQIYLHTSWTLTTFPLHHRWPYITRIDVSKSHFPVES